MQENLDYLSNFVGEEKAKEILKLTKAYDTYVVRFKKKLNTLLSEMNYEVKTGITFVPKQTEE